MGEGVRDGVRPYLSSVAIGEKVLREWEGGDSSGGCWSTDICLFVRENRVSHRKLGEMVRVRVSSARADYSGRNWWKTAANIPILLVETVYWRAVPAPVAGQGVYSETVQNYRPRTLGQTVMIVEAAEMDRIAGEGLDRLRFVGKWVRSHMDGSPCCVGSRRYRRTGRDCMADEKQMYMFYSKYRQKQKDWVGQSRAKRSVVDCIVEGLANIVASRNRRVQGKLQWGS